MFPQLKIELTSQHLHLKPIAFIHLLRPSSCYSNGMALLRSVANFGTIERESYSYLGYLCSRPGPMVGQQID